MLFFVTTVLWSCSLTTTDIQQTDPLSTSEAEVGEQSIQITEIQVDNDDTIATATGDFLDWIELYNSSDVTVSLKGWRLWIDGDVYPLSADLHLQPLGYTLLWCNDDLRASKDVISHSLSKKKPHTLVLLPPSMDRGQTVKVPALRTDLSWSWMPAYQDWRISVPTPRGENIFWQEPNAIEFQIPFDIATISSRSSAIEVVETVLQRLMSRVEVDKQGNIENGALEYRSTYDTVDQTLSTHTPPAYIRYRTEIVEEEWRGKPFEDGRFSRDRDLTLKYTSVEQIGTRDWVPSTPSTGDWKLKGKYEENRYPCGRVGYSVAFKAKDIEASHLTNLADIPYFPHLQTDIAIVNPELQRLSHRVDWTYCWEVESDIIEENLCLSLRYPTLEDAKTDKKPISGELSWRIEASITKNTRLHDAHQALFNSLLESRLYWDTCE